MNYWLIKTEPSTWSWSDQVQKGWTSWDGVRNYQASNNMKNMRLNDLCFFYHSMKERRIVGIVQVSKLYYPDPTDESNRFGMVDVKTFKPMNVSVTLAEIKNHPKLQNLSLIRQSRLSVMLISEEAWEIILTMGQTTI